jgi:hypothetical protein
MGLINLYTDLKSLKFGKDRIGGGSSSQPYIQTPIPEKLGEFGAQNQDFILRGGAKAVSDSALDVVRLGKYFKDPNNPSGLLFVIKQNLLSRMAVRTQASTGLLNEGIYTPLSTLAEAGGVAFGLHVNKQGLNPFSGLLTPGTSTPNNYEAAVLRSNTSALNLTTRVVTGTTFTSNGAGGQSIASETSSLLLRNRLVGLWNDKIIIDNADVNVLSYQGGPGSGLGIGKTYIKFASQRTQYVDNITNPLNKNNVLTYTNQQLGDIKNEPTQPITVVDPNGQLLDTQKGESFAIQDRSTTKVQDFRLALRNRLTPFQRDQIGLAPLTPDYLTQNIEQRIFLGNPGDRSGKNLNDYSTGVGNGAASLLSYDKITAQPLYQSDAVDPKKDTNDLVQFRIQVMSNLPGNVEKSTFIHFRAFLNAIDDSYEAQWDATKYLGRGESFYTYNGFNRKVSLSWTVAAQSKAELIPMYKKLNYLASTLAPDYSPTGGNMRGNMIKLTIGGYFYEQPGIITGLSYSITEDTSWEIGIGPDGQRDTTVSEIPHIIRVTGFNFIPIHEFVPRKVQQVSPAGKNERGETIFGAVLSTQERFISLGYGPGEYDNNYNN